MTHHPHHPPESDTASHPRKRPYADNGAREPLHPGPNLDLDLDFDPHAYAYAPAHPIHNHPGRDRGRGHHNYPHTSRSHEHDHTQYRPYPHPSQHSPAHSYLVSSTSTSASATAAGAGPSRLSNPYSAHPFTTTIPSHPPSSSSSAHAAHPPYAHSTYELRTLPAPAPPSPTPTPHAIPPRGASASRSAQRAAQGIGSDVLARHWIDEQPPPPPASAPHHTSSGSFGHERPYPSLGHDPRVRDVSALPSPPLTAARPTTASSSVTRQGKGGAGVGVGVGAPAPTRSKGVKRARATRSPSESGSEDDADARGGAGADGDGDYKLEQKREKNRVKQRNLRLRRANHVTELEAQISSLKADKAAEEARRTHVERKEGELRRYVADLEAVLAERGLRGELEALRNAWKGASYMGRPPGGLQGSGPHSHELQRTMTVSSGVSDASRVLHSSSGRSGTASEPGSESSRRNGHGTSSTSGAWTNGVDICPSPRLIRIEDLLSQSALFATLGDDGGGGDSTSSSNNDVIEISTGALVRSPSASAGSSSALSSGLPGTPSASETGAEWFMPLNLDFTVEPWMMEGWLHLGGLPPELGDPFFGQGQGMGQDGWGIWAYQDGDADKDLLGWDVETVQSGMSFGPNGFTMHQRLTPRARTRKYHPCVHVARHMLRSVVPHHPNQPISSWILPPLDALNQRVVLSAISQLGDPGLRMALANAQASSLPPTYAKLLLEYQTRPGADLRLILMPIAILRARIVTFLRDALPFDLEAFITHVLGDARIYGDVADPDAWEMTDTFWDVWGGWFPNGRRYCSSLHKHRRRFGNAGATVAEVIMGVEQPGARMPCLIGKPEGWVLPSADVRPDEGVVRGLRGAGVAAEAEAEADVDDVEENA